MAISNFSSRLGLGQGCLYVNLVRFISLSVEMNNVT